MTVPVDTPSLGRNATALSIGQSVVKAGPLLLTFALVRLLPSDEWTRTAYLLSIYLAGVTVSTLNLQHTILFFVRGTDAGASRSVIRRTALCIMGVGSLIALVLLAARSAITGGRLDVADSLVLVAIAIVFDAPSACCGPALVALDRPFVAAGADVVMTVIQLVVVIGAANSGHDAHAVATGIATAAAIRLALFVVTIGVTTGACPPGGPAGGLRRQILYGVPLGLSIATTVLNRSIDKWIVAAFRPGSIGVYTIAAQELPLLAVLPNAAGSAIAGELVDHFRSGRTERALERWHHLTANVAVVIVPVALGVVLVAKPLIHVMFGATFSSGVLPFQIFTLILLHRVGEYGMVLRAADRTRQLLLASIVLLVANLVAATVGAAMGGMTGAALGTLVANAVAWWYVLGQLADAFECSRRSAFPWRPWAIAIAAALVAATVAREVGRRVTSDATVMRIAVDLAVFASVYVVALRRARSWAR